MRDDAIDWMEEFLLHADEIGDDIIEDVGEMLGMVPFIFKKMRERPRAFALTALGDYMTARPESLDEKTAELICIAAAAASCSDQCLKVHIGAAKIAGATDDEILDTILIASLIGKTKILARSLRMLKETEHE
ncbi:MAG: carboxymuconolactone decarboxylase family protein [Methanomicrobiaceae archaeon]|nr:carboxymuconolactone decarboxylase family protein [Methanomicrobiaceae archaeon]